ncbi:hypothetical protein RRG08_015606 [Elysia crispata]|uniref:Uncharacterized protein n=1 Tax=Elysia crispata TaxID=231223 RepID=A0AAE1CYU4_9GAST|nr:hypothetical protein RRG08_015606 [Elysia crispata]
MAIARVFTLQHKNNKTTSRLSPLVLRNKDINIRPQIEAKVYSPDRSSNWSPSAACCTLVLNTSAASPARIGIAGRHYLLTDMTEVEF